LEITEIKTGKVKAGSASRLHVQIRPSPHPS
jgi:hypothetical protein